MRAGQDAGPRNQRERDPGQKSEAREVRRGGERGRWWGAGGVGGRSVGQRLSALACAPSTGPLPSTLSSPQPLLLQGVCFSRPSSVVGLCALWCPACGVATIFSCSKYGASSVAAPRCGACGGWRSAPLAACAIRCAACCAAASSAASPPPRSHARPAHALPPLSTLLAPPVGCSGSSLPFAGRRGAQAQAEALGAVAELVLHGRALPRLPHDHPGVLARADHGDLLVVLCRSLPAHGRHRTTD